VGGGDGGAGSSDSTASGTKTSGVAELVLQMYARFNDHVSSRTLSDGSSTEYNQSPQYNQFLTVQEVFRQLTPILDWESDPVRVVQQDLLRVLCSCLELTSLPALHSVNADDRDGGPAAQMLRRMLQHMDDSLLRVNALPILFHLANTHGVAQVVCCSLVPLIYGRVGLPQQLILRGILDRHLKDLNVRLRCTTMHALAKVATTADAYTAAWLVRLCQRAVGDGEEAVRATAIDSCAQIALLLPRVVKKRSFKSLEDQEIDIHLLRCKLIPLVQTVAEDHAWQVRWAVAQNCGTLCAAFGDHWSVVLIDTVQTLMCDENLRVKCAAVCALPRCANALVGFKKKDAMTTRPKNLSAGSADDNRADEDAGEGGEEGNEVDGSDTNDVEGELDGEGGAVKRGEEGVEEAPTTQTATPEEVNIMLAQMNAIDTLMPAAEHLLIDPAPDIRANLAWALSRLLVMMYMPADLNTDERYEQLQEKLDTNIFPLLLILLHDTDPTVALTVLRSLATDTTEDLQISIDSNTEDDNNETGAGGSDEPTKGAASGETPNGANGQRRLRIIGAGFPHFAERHVTKLLPSMQDLFTTRHWRLRMAAVVAVPVLFASSMGQPSTQQGLVELCVKGLRDNVERVRLRAAESLCLTAQVEAEKVSLLDAAAGAAVISSGLPGPRASSSSSQPSAPVPQPWLFEHLSSELRTMSNSGSFKERLTGLYLVEKLLPLPVAHRAFKAEVLAPIVVLRLDKDVEANPNVRLKTARLMGDLLHFFANDTAEASLLPALELAAEDSDRDVRYFSKRALAISERRRAI